MLFISTLLVFLMNIKIKLLETVSSDASTQVSAWSCNLKDSLQFSEFSLMSVEKCANISSQYSEPITYNGQLIQAKKYQDISVLLCSLKASFYTTYCSYSILTGSRLWNSEGEISDVQIELTKSECESALTTKTLRYSDRTYYAKQNLLSIELSPANTASGWLTLRGETHPTTGKCSSETFQFGRQTYKSHVLTMKYQVEIKQVNAVFNTAKRLIRIDKHTLIPNTLSGSYFSPQLGNFHYDKIDHGNLSETHWTEITRGRVQLYKPTIPNDSMPIAVLQTHESQANLAFSLYNQTKLCLSHSCRSAWKAELKDVYLVTFSLTGQSHWPLELSWGSEVDRLLNLQATLASVYLTRELALSSTFDKISKTLCERSRETILSNIQHYVSNVLIQEDKRNEDTRFFLRAGSVLYAIKCNERIAWIRSNTTDCHNDVPIYYINSDNQKQAGWLDPLTYVIKPMSRVVPCNDMLPFKFNLQTIDGNSQWICKNSNGFDVDCSPPITLGPMHPGKLYQPQDKTILPNMYSTEQLNSLDGIQWSETYEKADIKEWEVYLKKIKNKNPNLPVTTYFENIKNAIDEVSHIFSQNFWIQLAFKHFMPLVLLNYIFNMIVHIIQLVLKSCQVYKTAGLSITLVLHVLFGSITSIFPVLTNVGVATKCICPCTQEDYIKTLVKAVEDEERQKFLRNLSI